VSTAPRHRTSWISQNYDKLILVIVLVALLGSALFLFMQIDSKRKELTEARWEQSSAPPKEAVPIDLTSYDTQLSALDHPFSMSIRSNRMMISELRVSCIECYKPIEFNATICPFCKAKQPKVLNPTEVDSDADGIPDMVEEKEGLDPLDAADADADRDGDGFSNLEEYQAKSDMSDKESFPPPPAKLRLIRVGTRPFKLRFQGAAKLPDGTVRYQLNLRTLEQTFFAQLGEKIEGFEVIEYLPDAPNGPTLVLKKGDSIIRLVKGKPVTKSELVAAIISLIDSQRQRVKNGDIITMKGFKYEVIDIRRNGVLIRDEKTNKQTLIGRLSESEKEVLRGRQSASREAESGRPGMPHSNLR